MPKRNKVTFRTCTQCKRGFVVAPHRTRSVMCQWCEDKEAYYDRIKPTIKILKSKKKTQ